MPGSSSSASRSSARLPVALRAASRPSPRSLQRIDMKSGDWNSHRRRSAADPTVMLFRTASSGAKSDSSLSAQSASGEIPVLRIRLRRRSRRYSRDRGLIGHRVGATCANTFTAAARQIRIEVRPCIQQRGPPAGVLASVVQQRFSTSLLALKSSRRVSGSTPSSGMKSRHSGCG